MKWSLAIAFIACLGLACGPVTSLASRSLTSTEISPQETLPSSSTAVPAQVVSETAPPDTPTVPPETATDLPSTPTPDATQSALSTNLPPSLSLMMGLGSEEQYMNPMGTPLKSWKGIPIMPQATAGQAFGDNVYSFKADATLAQARSFYDQAHLSMGFGMTEPATGSNGSGSSATHSVTYMLTNGVLDINALDSDPGHIVVVIEAQ
jgi:hypothetical protein